MNKGLLLLGLTAGMMIITATAVSAGTEAVEPDEIKITTRNQEQPLDAARIENRIAELINQRRTESGMQAIETNSELSSNAELRATEVKDKFTHRRLDGSTFATAITVPYSSYGENIAYYIQGTDALSEEELASWVVDNWMMSTGHKENVLDSRWEETGIGVYVVDNTIFVSQLYIKK
ncbi:MAG: CAP domain-containing protein [Lachnospiraceae bacterium]